jgi:hypothetical protein
MFQEKARRQKINHVEETLRPIYLIEIAWSTTCPLGIIELILTRIYCEETNIESHGIENATSQWNIMKEPAVTIEEVAMKD